MSEILLDALNDIRQRLQNKEYKNEEHVRFSLVGRVLAALGWNIWSPNEVRTEDCPQPGENNTKVDINLHLDGEVPTAVFIECKNVGLLKPNVKKVEQQVAGYNGHNGADLIVLTDGRYWCLYYGTSKGAIAERRVAELDLRQDALTHIVTLLTALIGRSSLADGSAGTLIESLWRTQLRYRRMDALLEQAKTVSRSPRRSVAAALVELMREKHSSSVTENEASSFLKGEGNTLADQVRQIELRDSQQHLAIRAAARRVEQEKVPASLVASPTKSVKQAQGQLPLNVEKRTTSPVHFILKGQTVAFPKK